MAFYLKSNERVQDGVRRIVAEQVRKAIAEIEDPQLDRHATIHQVRKRCKKIRGVLRLARAPLGEIYSRENTAFRDAARSLSGLRDAEAMVETFDRLMDIFKDQVDATAFAQVRSTLTQRRARATADVSGLDAQLNAFRDQMHAALERVSDWYFTAAAFDAVGPGLVTTYGRGRKAMHRALADPTVENFHEWRKRAKYHRYHNRLLRELWKPVLRQVRNETVTLSEHLGNDHDLAVLRQTVLDTPGRFGPKRDLQALLGLIDRRSAELRSEAEQLGKRIFAEKPGALEKRFQAYWSAWREQQKGRSSKLSRQPAVVTA